MFRLRSKSGEESVFRSPEEIRSALLSGFVTPDAQIWDADLKGWVPLLEHALYQQIAASPPGRKSGVVKGPPSGGTKAIPPTPPGPKPVSKLVIKRPGEGGTTAMPAVKPPAPPAPPKAAVPPPPPKPMDEIADLELIDIDFTEEVAEAPVPPAPPAPRPTPATPKPPLAQKPAAAAPPPPPTRRPTPPPAPVPEPEPIAPRSSGARMSTPRMSVPMASLAEGAGGSGGSGKGLIIGAIILLAAAGGGYAFISARKGASGGVDTLALGSPAAPAVEATRPDSTTVDSTRHDSIVAPAAAVVAPVDTAKPAPTPVTTATALPPKPSESAAAAGGSAPVPFAPTVDRGPAPWKSTPIPGAPLSIPSLEAVRLRYLAAQAKALEQYQAGLASAGYEDMFNPAHLANANARSEAFDAVDAGRSALRDFRRRQASIDFAYTDSMRQALPPGSDTPDLRTFGPILRETPAQAALTDSLVGAVAEMWGLLSSEAGSYTFRAGQITWKDADNAERYQTLQEQLTAQIARIRNRPLSEIPPAMAATLRGIGLPR
jgi:hypothetical protein